MTFTIENACVEIMLGLSPYPKIIPLHEFIQPDNNKDILFTFDAMFILYIVFNTWLWFTLANMKYGQLETADVIIT